MALNRYGMRLASWLIRHASVDQLTILANELADHYNERVPPSKWTLRRKYAEEKEK